MVRCAACGTDGLLDRIRVELQPEPLTRQPLARHRNAPRPPARGVLFDCHKNAEVTPANWGMLDESR